MSLLSPQLQAFVAIAQEKTVHGAAASIHLTQTAVTQRIRSLETQLKTTLFIRSRKGMLLTEEGKALLRYCQGTRELEGEALSIITGAAKESEVKIRISSPSSMMKTRILPNCSSLLRKYPKLLLSFDVEDLDTRHQKLKSGECDFAILQPEDCSREMERKKLKPEEYILVCCSNWQKRSLKEIISNERMIDYDETDKTTIQYLKHFRLFSEVKPERHFVNSTELLATMVKQGHGYTTLTKEFVKPYLENGSLIGIHDNKVYEHQTYLAWYQRPEPPRYFLDIINAIQ
jgi:LysR family transcriptional regulator (chromosome initiation inhibitor)